MTVRLERSRQRQGVEIPVQVLVGVAVAAAFLLLRLGLIWQAPVGGEELRSLSGAWQTAAGNSDSRFLPTFFQALAALLLKFDDTEVLPRLLAYAAIATVPLAFHLLRPALGAAAALVALLLLAFDGPAIYASVAATTSGFDLPLMAWALLLLMREDLRERMPFWSYAPIGFLFATAGALVLPLLFALAVTDSSDVWRQRPSPARIALGAGAVVGLVFANVGFGFGADGFVIPPVAAFIDSFDLGPGTLTAADVVIVYTWPLLIAGLVGAFLLLRERQSLRRSEWTLLAWFAFALAWLVAAAGENTMLPVAALSLPLALIAAPAILAGITAAREADWNVSRFAIPVGIVLIIVATAYVADWGRNNLVGNGSDVARVIALYAAGVAALSVAGVEARSRGALVLPALVIGAIVVAIGALGVGLSAVDDPIPSPVSPRAAQVLRDLAIETREANGGEIVVHPTFEEDIAWPFRDSGDILIASRVPDDASIVLWPIDMAVPDGFVAVEGDWSLLDRPAAPTAGWLQFVRWYVDRNSLSVSHTALAVYIRAEQ